ncbi:hypothetical protein KKF73_05580 [Patescibacteria group bacterium]|nr:hypothetical protein [Patescibacteria group bacterium]
MTEGAEAVPTEEQLKTNPDLTTREEVDRLIRWNKDAGTEAFRVLRNLESSGSEKVEELEPIAFADQERRQFEWLGHVESRQEEISEVRAGVQAEINDLLQKLWPDRMDSKRDFYFGEIYSKVMEQYRFEDGVYLADFNKYRMAVRGNPSGFMGHYDIEFPEEKASELTKRDYEMMSQLLHLRTLVDMRDRLQGIAQERAGENRAELKKTTEEGQMAQAEEADAWIEKEIFS